LGDADRVVFENFARLIVFVLLVAEEVFIIDFLGGVKSLTYVPFIIKSVVSQVFVWCLLPDVFQFSPIDLCSDVGAIYVFPSVNLCTLPPWH
jgi:hypothetical protein